MKFPNANPTGGSPRYLELTSQLQAVMDTARNEGREYTAAEAIQIRALTAEAAEVGSQSQGRKAPPAPLPGDRDMDPFARAPSNLVAFKGRDGAANAYRSGMWLKAQLLQDTQAQRWCSDNGVFQAAAGEGVNTKGGFLVPDEMSREIIRLVEEYGVFRQECRTWPMSSDTLTVPRREGGLTAHFVGENAEGTESDMLWGNVSFTAKKLMCLSRMSSEISEDALISVADVLAEEVGLAFAEKEDQCGFNGTGAATYGGMRGVCTQLVDGTHTAGAVDTVTANADTFAELALLDLNTMMAKLPQYALKNAKFYCSTVCWSLVFERILAASGGSSVTNLGAPIQKMFLGYPVVVTQAMPTSTGSLNDVPMLLFGDLRKAASLGDRRQIRLMLSEHRYLELDQIGLKATERFDINVHDLGNNTTAGPIVGLIGKA